LVAAAPADGRLTVTDLRNGVPVTRALVGRGAVAEGAVQIEVIPGTRALEETERTMYVRYVASTVEILPPQRDPNGRWLPGGRSPNAGGVSQEKRELIDLARERSPAALDKIFAIMNDETVPPAVQLAAAGMILDRGYGKPKMSIETGDRGRTLEQLLEAVYEARRAEAETIDASASEPSDNTTMPPIALQRSAFSNSVAAGSVPMRCASIAIGGVMWRRSSRCVKPVNTRPAFGPWLPRITFASNWPSFQRACSLPSLAVTDFLALEESDLAHVILIALKHPLGHGYLLRVVRLVDNR